jgi:hypothetical protein
MPPYTDLEEEVFEAEIRSRVAVGLSRIQAEAVRSLKAADIPEKQAQAAMQKVIAATLRAIQLLDETAGAFEEELAKPGRSPDRQQWLTEQADELLRELQKATACIVATTLQQVKEDLLEQKSTPVQPGLGILIRETPPPTVLVSLVAGAKVLLWILGLLAGSIMAWGVSGQSFPWTSVLMALPIAALVKFGLSTRWLLLPFSFVALAVLLLVFS